jgi:hypothetical protein
MTHDDLIEMARQAGGMFSELPLMDAWVFDDKSLEAFAKLVAAKEREACAKVCDDNQYVHPYHDLGTLIRVRGQQ